MNVTTPVFEIASINAYRSYASERRLIGKIEIRHKTTEMKMEIPLTEIDCEKIMNLFSARAQEIVRAATTITLADMPTEVLLEAPKVETPPTPPSFDDNGEIPF